jgi:hypothetical protein
MNRLHPHLRQAVWVRAVSRRLQALRSGLQMKWLEPERACRRWQNATIIARFIYGLFFICNNNLLRNVSQLTLNHP